MSEEKYKLARSILRKYMADYSGQCSYTGKVKGGYFAYLLKETGEVYIGKTENFKNVLTRINSINPINFPTSMNDYIKAKKSILPWFLTQPDLFNIDNLIAELDASDLILGDLKPAAQKYSLISLHFSKPNVYKLLVRNEIGAMGRLDRFTEPCLQAEREHYLKGIGYTVLELGVFDTLEKAKEARRLHIKNNPECKYINRYV